MTVKRPPKQARTRTVEARIHELFEELGAVKAQVRELEKLLRMTGGGGGAKAEIRMSKSETTSNVKRKTETTASEFCPPSDF